MALHKDELTIVDKDKENSLLAFTLRHALLSVTNVWAAKRDTETRARARIVSVDATGITNKHGIRQLCNAEGDSRSQVL